MSALSAAESSTDAKQPLTRDSWAAWDITQVFTGNEEVDMGSIDFHKDGNFGVFSRQDGEIFVVDCISGKIKKSVSSKVYGVDIIRYFHHADCVLYSSGIQAKDCDIRYHSLYDNQYLRYFQGHTDRVTSLVLSPAEDQFLSASLDGTIRNWDIRIPTSTSVITCSRSPAVSPYVAYDPEGLVFAIHSDDDFIRLYDVRNQAAGPFTKFSLRSSSVISAMTGILASSGKSVDSVHINSVQFSPDGDRLLVGTNSRCLVELDSFEGDLLAIYADHQSTKGMKLGTGYSPDGQFVAAGSECGDIFIYSIQEKKLVRTLKNGHIGPIHDLMFNPKYHMLGSLHANAVLWGGC